MKLWCKKGLALAAVANLLLICYALLTSRRGVMLLSGGPHHVVSIEDTEFRQNTGDTSGDDEDLDNSASHVRSANFGAALRNQLELKMMQSLPRTSDEGVSCRRLLMGDGTEQRRALGLSHARPVPLDYRNDEFFAAQPCGQIRGRFITESLSREEASFPVAFSLIVFKDFYQVEKLFRAVYRPEHFYCFHVDAKSDSAFYQAVAQYASCFGNVAMSANRVDVQWGKFSVLEAELLCMQRLLEISKLWRYFINLTGQEFPLRSMLELVRILRALKGANNMENAGPRDTIPRLEVRLPDGSSGPIRWHKGSLHVTATRGFVEFAMSKAGRQISEHLRRHGRWPVPDEMFFATLNNNPSLLKVPGSDKTGLQTDNVKQPFLNRYKNWMFGLFGYPCLSRKIVRQVCIWGIRDLPAMNVRIEFFANKFYYNLERYGLQCIEERFWNSTMADYNITGYSKPHRVSIEFYSNFEFVRNHV